MTTSPLFSLDIHDPDAELGHLCTHCYAHPVPPKRWALGYYTCIHCGEHLAQSTKHTIVPMPKSNYIVVTDPALLQGLNSSHRGNR